MFLSRLCDYWVNRRIQHLVLHVTNVCNLRCAHCFVDFSSAGDIPGQRYVSLGQEVGKLMWLDISGGEPFMRKDLTEIVTAYSSDIIQISPNGTMPAVIFQRVDEIKKQTRAKLAISISVDGFEKTHDSIRGKAGVWRTAWETFEGLRGRGIPVKINTVLTLQNKGEIIELIHYVKERKPDFHSIILHRGIAKNELHRLPELHELDRLAPQIFKVLAGYDYGRNALVAYVLRNYHKYLWNLSLQTLRRKEQAIPCLAGRTQTVILGDGSVSSCELLPPVGNILKQSWAEIVTGESFDKQIRSIKNKKCYCTHNCALIDSVFFRMRSFFPLLYQRIATGSRGGN